MDSGRRIAILFFLAVVSVALLAPAGFADTITLKNGRAVTGQVVRYANGEFVVLLPPANSRTEQRDRLIIFADNVATIEFGTAAASAASPTSAAGPGEKVVVLDATAEIVPTGVQLRRGDRVRVSASGEMAFPDGRVSGPRGLDQRESWPFPGERFGILVALVGDPRATIYDLVGDSAEIEARRDGELFLQINARSLQGARGSYAARIQLLSGPSATTAPATTPAPAAPAANGRQLRKQIDVPADRNWTDTGLDLQPGDTLRLSAEGTINYTSTRTTGPGGASRELRDILRALPVNDAGRGALIGLIGQAGVATPFFIGTAAEFTVDRSGRFFLGLNDDDYRDNRGSFRVNAEIVPAAR